MNNTYQKHRIIIAYLFVFTAIFLLTGAFYLSVLNFSGYTIFVIAAILLFVWASILISASKITARDAVNVIFALRGRDPPS